MVVNQPNRQDCQNFQLDSLGLIDHEFDMVNLHLLARCLRQIMLRCGTLTDPFNLFMGKQRRAEEIPYRFIYPKPAHKQFNGHMVIKHDM
jgi:hypothetical protein